MAKKVIDKAKLQEILARLGKLYRIYAPVRQNGAVEFQEVEGRLDIVVDFHNCRISPKGFMLPQTEYLFTYTTAKDRQDAAILHEVRQSGQDRIIFAIRPCDARSFQLLDLNFQTADCVDPWWLERRDSTILIGLACNTPCSTCFCTSVGGGPFATEGLDVLLIDTGSTFVAQECSEKGKRVLQAAGIDTEAPAEVIKQADELQKKAESSISSTVPTDNLREQDLKALFQAEFWEPIQFACINCGVCTFLCPTCWCFDIQDEVRRERGVRLRLWDSCMFPLFTLHGSGHNPRAQKLQRVRQRFMHKLKYFVDKYQTTVACVGCGRCVEYCPVNIDIRQVFQLMNDYEA
ncbi:MAG: 4Fe-4S dicluster domain-containing protein [Deltaproteobacteria bacterium]|nr:4Fe-4S dicluster domain-containing protein [Deltaproteobacteria bacterium]MBW2072237.1 4Fe-4S dicluster domain-containing protein [Deltaproteobacteria bacterium]